MGPRCRFQNRVPKNVEPQWERACSPSEEIPHLSCSPVLSRHLHEKRIFVIFVPEGPICSYFPHLKS
ncbi:hypothetical protein AV530_000422 [Patagioenas fasciata monilis]|uniref:Uncharacterized protein n=1 Tax=Patagioenas fasciata monilis TaxID=372326 RepID=A0A1V4K5F6_PATFA|nr:hypothetical protein AV530_000422 [Patagioenas fasciata monilis]